MVSFVVSSQAGIEGVWGGKWDDTWPVFLEIKATQDPEKYTVQYFWVENPSDKALSQSRPRGGKVGGHFKFGYLYFRIEDGAGLLYGAFSKPRMARLVRVGTEVPAAKDCNSVLQEHGWKRGAIPASDALKAITRN